MIHLKNDRLHIELCEPGEDRNHGTRFDRTGYIQQVWLDGQYFFCADEPDDPDVSGSCGAGICSEINCQDAYEETAAGEWFPKFGVGLLQKVDDEPYHFQKRYRLQPFQVEWKFDEESVSFSTLSFEYAGRALYNEKKIWIERNRLSIEYYFQNTGSKSLALTENSHDFFTLNGNRTGSDYLLKTPQLHSQERKKSILTSGTLTGVTCGFSFLSKSEEASLLPIEGNEIIRDVPFTWEMTHAKIPIRITASISFAPHHVLIWSKGSILSLEIYHAFILQPDESIAYTRHWVFEGNDTEQPIV